MSFRQRLAQGEFRTKFFCINGWGDAMARTWCEVGPLVFGDVPDVRGFLRTMPEEADVFLWRCQWFGELRGICSSIRIRLSTNEINEKVISMSRRAYEKERGYQCVRYNG